MVDAPLDRVAPTVAVRRDSQVERHGAVVGMGKRDQRGPHQVLGGVPEHPLDRGTLVEDDGVDPDDGHDVGRHLDQAAEPRLGSFPVDLLGELLTLEGEHDLRDQDAHARGDAVGEGTLAAHDDDRSEIVGDDERIHRRRCAAVACLEHRAEGLDGVARAPSPEGQGRSRCGWQIGDEDGR